VLFIVLMTSIIIMIISASILSQSMNEINFAQQQIDEITTDQLQKGIFWNGESSGNLGDIPATSIQLNGRTYTYTLSSTGTSAGITSYSIIANYDTFN
jgi:hypothetical protein